MELTVKALTLGPSPSTTNSAFLCHQLDLLLGGLSFCVCAHIRMSTHTSMSLLKPEET